jgi:putative ABC transport system permease protein
MQSVYHSLILARTNFYAAYRLGDVFVHLKRAPESVSAQLRQIAGVIAVNTRVLEDVTLSVPDLAEPATGRLISLPTSGAAALNGLAIAQGRLPSLERPDEVIASATFAAANSLAVGSRIGAILNARWKDLTIVGLALSPEYVYEVSPSMIFPDNRRFGVLWMNHDALSAAFNMKNAFNDAALRLAHGASEKDCIDRVNKLVAPYGGMIAYGRAEQVSNRFLSDELGEIRINATYLPAIFLGVSAFLVYTLLSRLISIQRAQIALLKAFGYSNPRIGVHFIEFALLIVAVGLTLGLALGIYLGKMLIGVYRMYFHFPVLQFQLPFVVVASAVVIATMSAALGSVIAVHRAVALPPAEAIRPEAPRSYRAGLLESMGLLSYLGTNARVILRNIARRPWRAALSVSGIAAAVATVVVGRFTFDAANHLMSVHFDSSQREDVTVNLTEARSPAALLELRRLPGVLRAEPFRSVSITLRVGFHEKQTTLLGLPATADLRQLIDVQRRRIDLPPDGLVLTRKLALMVGARTGDIATIDQLDGRRLTFTEPIIKLSDEPLGISSYMSAPALSHVLHEDNEISGAVLQIDRSREQELYRTIKRTPGVAAVALRAAMLSTVRETMNRSFILMTIVLTVFACVLVVGVVYNSARISLSERGNELASLRVLGFSNTEVTTLLLGEQAVLMLSAVPLGCALGASVARLLIPVFDRELFRLPFVLTPRTFAFAVLVTLSSALFSATLIISRIRTLDLIAVLKSRE